MSGLWLVSYLLLWGLVGLLAFLLIGALRLTALLTWRLDQMEATTPRHIGRGGLEPGSVAPEFALPAAHGGEISLRDHPGQLLLVFMQAQCKPCQAIVPQLNRLHDRRTTGVLTICHGDEDEVRAWAVAANAHFPVAIQTDWSVSRRYEVFATPFAFVIDAHRVVQAKGIISDERYIKFLLNAGRKRVRETAAEPTQEAAQSSRAAVLESGAAR